MKNFKNENGITLIALIITIIVMLILVGVTINVALNGGLFNKAKNAAIQTEEQSIFEQLISLANYTNNGEIDVEETYSAIQNEFGESNVSLSNGTLNILGKHGTYTYTLTSSKIAIGEKNDDSRSSGETEEEDNTGESVVKSKELIPDPETEKPYFGTQDESGYLIASNSEGTIEVKYVDYTDFSSYSATETPQYNIRLITIVVNNTDSYIFAPDTISAQNYANMLNSTSNFNVLENMQEKTWYYAAMVEGVDPTFTVYEDASTFGDNMNPISLDDFEGGTVNSSSYLTRVINSF